MCKMRDTNRIQEYLDNIQLRTKDLKEALAQLKRLVDEILFLKDELFHLLDGLDRELHALQL